MNNSFGRIFKITSFGESHGPAVGVVIDGCPPGVTIDESKIHQDLQRRKPGQSKITTARKESEHFSILSGVFEGKSTGAPICIVIPNEDAKSKDYSHIANKYRPSHADFTYQEKYGIRDYRGGGRSSARVTAGWVAAGAIAKMMLSPEGITTRAYVSKVGTITSQQHFTMVQIDSAENNIVRCPDPETAEAMIHLIEEVKKEGDTIGGVVSGVINGVPAGLGEPLFNKLHAALGKAMLSINAVKGFEYGSGFAGVEMKGSQHNDEFTAEDDAVVTKTNYSGGIQGGISNGQEIYFKVAFKPVATIMTDQESVDVDGNPVTVRGKGRHDPCVVPRAVPIVEAMAALVMADFHLISKTNKLRAS
jgi:chorismate synthase